MEVGDEQQAVQQAVTGFSFWRRRRSKCSAARKGSAGSRRAVHACVLRQLERAQWVKVVQLSDGAMVLNQELFDHSFPPTATPPRPRSSRWSSTGGWAASALPATRRRISL
jgi:hypothetical protein